MIMTATVLEVQNNRLLVRDSSNGQEVLVNTRCANRFSRGNFIRIRFNGITTLSIPPQITAISIQRLQNSAPPPQPTSSEIRGIIIRGGRSSLEIREAGTNRLLIVEYPYAFRFRAGQRISVRYETIFLNVSPESSRIIAIDITTL